MPTQSKASEKPAQSGKSASRAQPAAAARKRAPTIKQPAARRPAAPAQRKAAGAAVTPEQRRCYVEVAAYYIAERRGFHGGGELDDWVQAEAEITRLLEQGLLKP